MNFPYEYFDLNLDKVQKWTQETGDESPVVHEG